MIKQELIVEFERLKWLKNPQQRDYDMIFSLYKLYVNPDAGFYTSNCNCSTSIENIYIELMAWYENNK